MIGIRNPRALAAVLLLGIVAGGLTVLPARAEKGDLVRLLKLALPAAERFTQDNNLEALRAKAGQPLDAVRGVFYGYRGEKKVGAAVWTATPAYTPNEPLHAMTGLDQDGTVVNVIVLRHQETPGWVDPINNGSFQRQFIGIEAADKLTLVVNGRRQKRGDIVAIANSTISSKAVAVGVSQARKLFFAALAGTLRGE